MKKPTVLILDDDPSHLRIYGWIIESAGFDSVPALVTFDTLDLPEDDVDLVLLDYSRCATASKSFPTIASSAHSLRLIFRFTTPQTST